LLTHAFGYGNELASGPKAEAALPNNGGGWHLRKAGKPILLLKIIQKRKSPAGFKAGALLKERHKVRNWKQVVAN